jgi:hypothetical protein
MRLHAAPRLRRQAERRREAVREAIRIVGEIVDLRSWNMTWPQYARLRDLWDRRDRAPGLDDAERDELEQLWAWLTAGFDAPAVTAWLRVPGHISHRELRRTKPPAAA